MTKLPKGSQVFVLLLLPVSFFICCKSPEKPSVGTFQYASFRDVPGVTDDEINAIEALREQNTSFVYGIIPTTEAFYAEDHNIVINGYAALFCNWLSEFFDIPFIPAIYEWGDLIDGLETGQIDFSGDLSPNDERRKTYFMTGAIAQRTLKYIRLKSAPPVSEVAAARPLRLVLFDNSVTHSQVVSSTFGHSSESGAFEAFYVNDNKAAYDLLESGKADAILTEDVLEAAYDIYGEVTADDFFPLVFSSVSLTTQNPALLPVISVVQKALQNGASHYLTQLYSQGSREYLKHKLFMRLSDEEKAYIDANPVVLFLPEHDNYPLCFYNAQEKQWQGIAFEVMSEVEALTGLSFRIADEKRVPWPVMVQMLEQGKVSMLTELIQSEERKGRFIWPDTAIITDNYALLSKSEYKNVNTNEIPYARVGLPKGTAYTEFFKRRFPDHEYTTEYESSDGAFQALDRGEVDMVMSSQYRFLLLTNYREFPGYKANVIFDQTFNSTFGFYKEKKILCSVVDKALGMINIKGITEQWMHKTFDYRVKLAHARIPWLVGATALGLGLLFLLTLFRRNRHESKRLENLVQERTIEMNRYQRELEAALEAAETANSSKSVFLANMSHEIRTPMNSIVGFSELALDDETPPKAKEYINKILENAKGLLQIINDILDISKVESGKMELENIPFDMHELFSICRNVVIPKAAEKGIMLHFYAEPSIGKKPLGDPTRLRQVFVNLLTNAVKFTNTGIVKLHSAIKEKTEKTITMYFEIKDSGIGMTPEQIARIFEPFLQAESGTTRKFGGTGLGLPITKNIVELMGGQLSVESAPGVGSKFSFILTFDTIDVSGEDTAAEKIVFNDMEKPAFEGEVLLCEDNTMNQQVISEHLTRVGLTTVVAENGKTGVDLVQDRIRKGQKLFDLIFMDMHMPVMDGLEAAAKIQELNTGVPVVALTANIMTNDRELYRMSGMNDCLGKPFTSQELWRCLMTYFKPVHWQKENKAGQIQAEKELRQKLINNFVEDNRNRFTEIAEAINCGDIKLAHRLAHTLKGNAGQLGKNLLQKAAADIEGKLKDGLSAGKNYVTQKQLAVLETELNAVLAEFIPLVNKAVPPAETGTRQEWLDAGSVRDLLKKLEALIEMGNPLCREFIGSLRQIPESGELIREKLIQQIDDLDFDLALASLAELKKKLLY